MDLGNIESVSGKSVVVGPSGISRSCVASSVSGSTGLDISGGTSGKDGVEVW